MNNMFVSVVMSTYNDEKFIATAIQSILNQTYKYFEFIIVNDGSTDDTLSVIKRFNDSRIVLIDKTNSGLPDSLNIGFKAAKYDWVARMDADDIALPDRLENQIKYICKNVGVIGGQAKFIDGDGNLLSESISSNPENKHLCKLYTFLGWNPVIHPSVLINKKIFFMCNGYDTNFTATQDYDLWCRMASHSAIINIPNQVLFYRVHSNSISKSKNEKQRILSFLGYTKKALNIDKSLTFQQFEIMRNIPYVKKSTDRAKLISERLYSLNVKYRVFLLVKYYAWRFYYFIKLRIQASSYRKRILNN